jgi:tetratricopeptide (TPR) repeat protein
MSAMLPGRGTHAIGQPRQAAAQFPYGLASPDASNGKTLSRADASLLLALGRWKPMLDHAWQLAQTESFELAFAPASEAIRLSADVHPQYHFLESGLHTALGSLHLRHGEWEEATRHFDRAVFLHHDNDVAQAGQGAAARHERVELPPYTHAKTWVEWMEFCGVAQSELQSGFFEPWVRAGRAAKTEAVSLFSHAITLCDATHRQYHALAAQPWWLRAALHRALGEPLLAMNDLSRGLDLDRQNGWALAQMAELKE